MTNERINFLVWQSVNNPFIFRRFFHNSITCSWSLMKGEWLHSEWHGTLDYFILIAQEKMALPSEGFTDYFCFFRGEEAAKIPLFCSMSPILQCGRVTHQAHNNQAYNLHFSLFLSFFSLFITFFLCLSLSACLSVCLSVSIAYCTERAGRSVQKTPHPIKIIISVLKQVLMLTFLQAGSQANVSKPYNFLVESSSKISAWCNSTFGRLVIKKQGASCMDSIYVMSPGSMGPSPVNERSSTHTMLQTHSRNCPLKYFPLAQSIMRLFRAIVSGVAFSQVRWMRVGRAILKNFFRVSKRPVFTFNLTSPQIQWRGMQLNLLLIVWAGSVVKLPVKSHKQEGVFSLSSWWLAFF